MKRYLLLFAAMLVTAGLQAQKTVSVKSPDGNIRFSVTLEEGSFPEYDVYYNDTQLVKDARMGFEFDSGIFGDKTRPGKLLKRSGIEVYDLVVGKSSHVEDPYNEMVIPLEEYNAPFRKVNIAVKVFDDGAAFRYEFPEQENWSSYVMLDELTSFNPDGDPDVLTMFLGSYTTSHEGFYWSMKYSEVPSGELMEMPALYSYDGVYMAITEAAVRDYAGMYLMKESGCLKGKLSPLPGQTEEKVKAELPHKTPWRVLMIGEKPGTLISSDILTSLNEPCKIKDTSWIKPGKTTFSWWNGNEVPDTTFLPGNNFATNKYYIDFAAGHGIDFHSIYGYAEQPWYEDKNMNFEHPAPDANVMRTVKSLDMDAVAAYAAQQGVGLHMWVNWKPLYARLDEALAQFEKWGVRGMMVDFMDRDDQEMIRIQEEILAAAAEHKIFVQFHGACKPTGLNRTYPNEFAREGTRNYECFKWSKDLGADLDVSIPFTRLLAGVTDYHLGGFRAVPVDKFKIQYTNPLVTVTRSHMLGMYVVLECYLGMVCDSPMSYLGQPGFEFIQQVPTVWDETVVPDASVNEYAVVARRNGENWYVGAINNTERRSVSFKTDFLGEGQYVAEIYCDNENTESDPDLLDKKEVRIDRNSVINIEMAGSGGFAIRIMPEK
ncbi:MAG: glycoside hydrolase family 97 protein [Bacteroidetes bacterium]|uniref:Glycoside hydrolase family 97 protein n=1 Tax=Candidatus Cryptobacteroides avicola TaxID=2840757 RepID=A0A940DR51_9BACT|nr:glycoside hydrolase family 97 protein [Candidatus Cryptobacteroides avicola]